MSSLLFIGGVGSSKASVERIVDAAVDRGYVSDGEGLTLAEAKQLADKRIATLARQAGFIGTHSAGAIMMPKGIEVTRAMLVAPPERRSLGGLLMGAVAKTLDHVVARTPYPRREHLRVAASTTALAGRDIVSALKVRNFSTSHELKKGNLTNPEVTTYVAMSQDRFFPGGAEVATAGLAGTGATVRVIEGHHDDISVAPEAVLKQVLPDPELLTY